jgi:hypothetical protein
VVSAWQSREVCDFHPGQVWFVPLYTAVLTTPAAPTRKKWQKPSTFNLCAVLGDFSLQLTATPGST